MTVYELAERDYHKAVMNFERAKTKPNAPKSELDNLEALVTLRKGIFEIVEEHYESQNS